MDWTVDEIDEHLRDETYVKTRREVTTNKAAYEPAAARNYGSNASWSGHTKTAREPIELYINGEVGNSNGNNERNANATLTHEVSIIFDSINDDLLYERIVSE